MKHLLIIGARGYGRIVYNIALDCVKHGANFEIKGFLDDKKDALLGFDNYPPIISSVEDYEVQKDDVFICALGDVKYKKIYTKLILEKEGEFISLISPMATIMTNVHIGVGCIIGAQSIVGCDSYIGDYVTILGMVDVGHDICIEDWCHLGAFSFMGGGSKMCNSATLQTGSKILPHKIVGENAIVGIGSICLKNVKENTTVYGNPARTIKL